jgi:hypothetical protein
MRQSRTALAIEACLRAQSSKIYHLGFRSTIARNTLANGA